MVVKPIKELALKEKTEEGLPHNLTHFQTQHHPTKHTR
jgi:hypothetical protein